MAETVSIEDVDRVRAAANFQQSQSVSEARESIGESSVCDGNKPVSAKGSDSKLQVGIRLTKFGRRVSVERAVDESGKA